MIITGGLNSIWVAHLIGAATRRAIAGARIMTITVGFLSFFVGLLAVAGLFNSSVNALGEAWATALGGTVILTIAVAFRVATRLKRGAQ